MGIDGLQKLKKMRHSLAVKSGIKKAKRHKKLVKTAKLALRKHKKSEIVKSIFRCGAQGAGNQE